MPRWQWKNGLEWTFEKLGYAYFRQVGEARDLTLTFLGSRYDIKHVPDRQAVGSVSTSETDRG